MQQHCRPQQEEVGGVLPSDLSTFLAGTRSGEQAVRQRAHRVKSLPRPDLRRAALTITFVSRQRTTQHVHHSIICQREEDSDHWAHLDSQINQTLSSLFKMPTSSRLSVRRTQRSFPHRKSRHRKQRHQQASTLPASSRPLIMQRFANHNSTQASHPGLGPSPLMSTGPMRRASFISREN